MASFSFVLFSIDAICQMLMKRLKAVTSSRLGKISSTGADVQPCLTKDKGVTCAHISDADTDMGEDDSSCASDDSSDAAEWTATSRRMSDVFGRFLDTDDVCAHISDADTD